MRLRGTYECTGGDFSHGCVPGAELSDFERNIPSVGGGSNKDCAAAKSSGDFSAKPTTLEE